MTRNAPDAVRHAASSIQTEEQLNARHVNYRFEANFAIDQIVDAEGQQVRLIENRAPADMVARYSQQMKAGTVFPAIVVNERGELIDGNTRRQASVKAGRSTIAAYICSGLTALEARSLSVELNQANGLAMSERELRAYVRGAVNQGQALDAKACARITGMPPSKIERWKAEALFELRAQRANVADSDIALLQAGTKASLNSIRLAPVFVEATKLAVAARMSPSATKKLVGRVNTSASEGDALREVAAERDARADEIRSIASGFASKRPVGQRSAMHIAALLKVRVDEMLAVAPDKRGETVSRLQQLRDHVESALHSAVDLWELDTSESREAPPSVVPLAASCG